MSKKNGKKGQMRVVEAILASFIIILALSFVNFFTVNPTSQKYEITEMEKLGYNALHDLDMQGLLTRFVYEENWASLRDALSVSLPLDLYFNLTVLNLNNDVINDMSISYGDAQSFETSKVISSVTYVLVGHPTQIEIEPELQYEANYEPRVLSLQLIRG